MDDLVVYEKKPLNAAAFARLGELELRQVRSLKQLEQVILPPDMLAMVAVEATKDNLVEVARLVWRMKQMAEPGQKPAVVVMPDSTVQTGVTLLLEAGADFVFRSMLDRDDVASLMRAVSHRAAEHKAMPRDETTFEAFRSSIFGRMPWKRWATGGSG